MDSRLSHQVIQTAGLKSEALSMLPHSSQGLEHTIKVKDDTGAQVNI